MAIIESKAKMTEERNKSEVNKENFPPPSMIQNSAPLCYQIEPKD